MEKMEGMIVTEMQRVRTRTARDRTRVPVIAVTLETDSLAPVSNKFNLFLFIDALLMIFRKKSTALRSSCETQTKNSAIRASAHFQNENPN